MNEFVSGNTENLEAAGEPPTDAAAGKNAADAESNLKFRPEPAKGESEVDVLSEADPSNETAAPGEADTPDENALTGETFVEDAAENSEVDPAEIIAQRDAHLADLQRLTAEFANFKRQTAKRNTEVVAQAASGLVKKMLVVLDACEAAVSQGVAGIEPLQSQLLGVLSAEGLTVLGQADEPFDPEFHEAVTTEPSSDESQSVQLVAEVFRTGYAWNGRVLRPAMVKVRG